MRAQCIELPFENIQKIQPLWRKLVDNNTANSIYFSDLFKTFTFDSRVSMLEDKIAAGYTVKTFVMAEENTSFFIGYCMITYDSIKKHGEIEMIYVDEKFRGHGFGTILMNKALNQFTELNISQIKICVAHGNEKALKYYERFGFYPFTLDLYKK